VQPVAFKATEEKKEESTSSRLPIDASKLDNEEIALIIKSFRQILKQRKGRYYKPRSKKVCYKCGKPGHFIATCLLSSDSDRGNDKKGKRREKKRYYKKKDGDAHVCREWDSDESSTNSSDDEDAANITVNKGLLFPNVSHKCLMAKDDKKKKVKSRASTKYATSSDEASSSDDDDDLLTLLPILSAFRDRGVLGPTSEMSSRAPAQMGRRETEREGGKKRQPEREREVEILRPSCLSRAQVGCACSRGLQASAREGERAASRERLSRSLPRAANPL
jgi:hypothetical protein